MSQTQSQLDAVIEQRYLADQAPLTARAEFLKKTYMHLMGAIIAFIGLEVLLMYTPGIEKLASMMTGVWWAWLAVLGVYMLVAGVAERMAQNAESLSTQYLGLAIFIVVEAIIFVPLIYFAKEFAPPQVIPTAALATLATFAVLTAIVFTTKKDFSFMRSFLIFASFLAFGAIICAILFGFEMGIIFPILMIGLMAGWVLYHTSNVLHHYHTDQYVVASLALFASLATLFWYMIQLVWHLYGEE